MTRAKAVVFALFAFGEARKSAALAQIVKILLSAGQDFMYVTLVTDVEDQVVFRQVENSVNGNGQLYDAEI